MPSSPTQAPAARRGPAPDAGTVDLVALGIVGGRTVRGCRPDPGSGDYLRSTAVLPLAGRPIIEWLVEDLNRQGVRDICVLAHEDEHRLQAEAALGRAAGSGAGLRFATAARPGWTAAFLAATDGWQRTGPVLVIPTDSLFRLDLRSMAREHVASGAALTVGAVQRDITDIAGRHDVLQVGPTSRLTGVISRPSLADLRAEGSPAAARRPVNTGIYLIDPVAIQRFLSQRDLAEPAYAARDLGPVLLPWLVRNGYPVQVRLIGEMGGVDTPRDYLETLHTALRGGFGALHRDAEGYVELPGQRWIHESSLLREDALLRSLRQRLADGSVRLGHGVHIGRDVTIRSGVRITDADVGDGALIEEECVLEQVACGPGSVIGPFARLQDCYLGAGVEVRSSADAPTTISGYSVIGDGATVMPGARIHQVSVYPRLAIPADRHLPEGMEVASAAVLETLAVRSAAVAWPA